jgi:hypothetical protein
VTRNLASSKMFSVEDGAALKDPPNISGMNHGPSQNPMISVVSSTTPKESYRNGRKIEV